MELALAANSAARPCASKRPRGARHASHLWGLGSLTVSLRLRVRELVGRPSRAADTAQHMGWFFLSKAEKLYEAAGDGDEAELRRLIDLGGNVNWHHPEVRRRMFLAWAPASSSPLSSVAPAAPARHGAIFPTAQLHGARRTPACSPIRLTPWPLMMARVCVQDDGETALMKASICGNEGCVRLLLESGATEVNATEVSLQCPLPARTRHGSASI
jgi:hypothetical protein